MANMIMSVGSTYYLKHTTNGGEPPPAPALPPKGWTQTGNPVQLLSLTDKANIDRREAAQDAIEDVQDKSATPQVRNLGEYGKDLEVLAVKQAAETEQTLAKARNGDLYQRIVAMCMIDNMELRNRFQNDENSVDTVLRAVKDNATRNTAASAVRSVKSIGGGEEIQTDDLTKALTLIDEGQKAEIFEILYKYNMGIPQTKNIQISPGVNNLIMRVIMDHVVRLGRGDTSSIHMLIKCCGDSSGVHAVADLMIDAIDGLYDFVDRLLGTPESDQSVPSESDLLPAMEAAFKDHIIKNDTSFTGLGIHLVQEIRSVIWKIRFFMEPQLIQQMTEEIQGDYQLLYEQLCEDGDFNYDMSDPTPETGELLLNTAMTMSIRGVTTLEELALNMRYKIEKLCEIREIFSQADIHKQIYNKGKELSLRIVTQTEGKTSESGGIVRQIDVIDDFLGREGMVDPSSTSFCRQYLDIIKHPVLVVSEYAKIKARYSTSEVTPPPIQPSTVPTAIQMEHKLREMPEWTSHAYDFWHENITNALQDFKISLFRSAVFIIKNSNPMITYYEIIHQFKQEDLSEQKLVELGLPRSCNLWEFFIDQDGWILDWVQEVAYREQVSDYTINLNDVIRGIVCIANLSTNNVMINHGDTLIGTLLSVVIFVLYNMMSNMMSDMMSDMMLFMPHIVICTVIFSAYVKKSFAPKSDLDLDKPESASPSEPEPEPEPVPEPESAS